MIEESIDRVLKSLVKREALLNNIPALVSILVILTWVLLIVSRSQSSFPLIALIDLQIGGAFFIALSGAVLFSRKAFFRHLLFGFMVVQTLIMGLNSQLFFLGCFWGVLSTIFGVSLYRRALFHSLRALQKRGPTEPVCAPTPMKNGLMWATLLIGAVALLNYGRTLTQPGLEDNQMCYFATAHQSSYHEGVEKFSRVWEIKPIFHRAPIYGVYWLATEWTDYYDKVSFESAVNSIYGLLMSLLVVLGVFLGRKRFQGFSGLHWTQIALLGVGFQTVMVVRFFEVEEMVFALSLLGLGMLLSRNMLLVLLSPFVFLEITLLKGLTLFTPVGILLFSMLLIPFTKKEYITFAIGSILSLLTLFLFFKAYPLFMEEYGSARSIQQSTVFFFALVRILTFVGALAKGMLTNPFLFVGISSFILLLGHYTKYQKRRETLALILMWSFLSIMPLLMGKSFTYYALPLTIGAFLSILLLIGELPQLLKAVGEKGFKKSLSIAVLVPLIINLLQFPFTALVFASGVGVVLFILNKKGSGIERASLFLLLFAVTNLVWMGVNQSWLHRDPAKTLDEPEINQLFAQDTTLRSEQMLYLTFGPEPYHLGLQNSNRYFYTLPFRRHLQMVNASEKEGKEFDLIRRFTAESAAIIEQARPVQECLEEALAFNGTFILHSFEADKRQSGWCRRDLFPALDVKIAKEYEPLTVGKTHILYKRKEGSSEK